MMRLVTISTTRTFRIQGWTEEDIADQLRRLLQDPDPTTIISSGGITALGEKSTKVIATEEGSP